MLDNGDDDKSFVLGLNLNSLLSKVDVEDSTIFVRSTLLVVAMLVVPPLLCFTTLPAVFSWLRLNGSLS